MISSANPQADQSPLLDPHRNDEYFKQLGILLSAYAQAESHIFVILVLTSGVSIDVGRALFSGTRAKDAISLIRRIFAVKQFPRDFVEMMESCFEQIININEVRNYLVHHGTDFTEQRLKTTNVFRSHLPDREVVYEVSPSILHTMSLDLTQILATLGYCLHRLLGDAPATPPPEAMKAQQRSWLYKSSAQASKGRKSPGTGQKRQRQPQPSQE